MIIYLKKKFVIKNTYNFYKNNYSNTLNNNKYIINNNFIFVKNYLNNNINNFIFKEE